MRHWIPSLLLTVALLTACVAQTQPSLAPPKPVTATPLKMFCRVVPPDPTPQPQDSLFPPVGPEDFSQGPSDAVLTIIVYSDFQCRSCADLADLLKTLRADHPDEVQLVYRHLPLADKNDKSVLAARAANAAARQGKFWEMHDALYEKQAEWMPLAPTAFSTWLAQEAENVGLNLAQFGSDMESTSIIEAVGRAAELAKQIPVPPLVIVNGRLQAGVVSYYSLDTMLHLLLLSKRQFTSCPPMLIDPAKQYLATLHTEKGNIVIQLFAERTPFTVNNFVFLARQGWFDNITFHRVIPGFVAQTGDPSGTGMGGPGYFIPNEIDSSLRFDRAGVVGMANSGADMNGSQFFITLAPAPHLNGQYTVFGEVISGLETAIQLTPRDPQPGIWLPPGDILHRVTIEER